jgi:hypothetical protein
MNVNFFRSPSIASWKRLSGPLRRELEEFSIQKCEWIVKALRPKKISVIGLGIFEKLAVGQTLLKGNTCDLVRKGEMWGIPALGVIHLSGARVSASNREKIR